MIVPTPRDLLRVLVLAFGLSAIAVSTAPGRALASAQFTPTDCPETFAALPLTLECGLVTVPLTHDAPEQGTIELAVFRARATGDAPAPDPLVLLQGGPGGSVDTLVFAAAAALTDILAERDLVFIEQRGNRYSRPALTCPAYTDRLAAALSETTDTDTLNQIQREAVSACLAEFAAAGIDLTAFDSYENARDIPTVVLDGLGYDSYNLYGVSYGSLLAQHVMEVAPRGLRSVILDAVVPRDLDFNQRAVDFGWRAFNRLAAACATDAACAEANPDLLETLLDLIERVNAEPVDVPFTNPASGETIMIKLEGSRLATAVFNSLYDTAGLTRLPGQITAAAQQGDFAWAAQTLGALLDPGFSMGMNWAVNCAERAYGEPVISPDVPAIFAQALLEEASDYTDLCPLVDVPLIPAEANTPTDVAIPTLLLSGEYDPVTPPEYGDRVAQTLPQAVHVVFPAIGHGAMISDACPAAIAAAFLDDPTAEPDRSCIESLGLRFTLSFDLVERTVGTATFLVPADWTEVEAGVYTDMGANLLAVQEVEGQVLAQQIDRLLSEGLAELNPDPIERREVQLGEYTWTLLRIVIPEGGIALFAAGTETAANTYIILVQGEAGAAQQLEESLLVPVLTAFRGE
ncbi:MAG: alpha/beta fold hydrolase [Candidatus Flexifilum sp.]|jgi:pimeloyl-ACP methyl ester carboxylesterase